MLLWYNTTNILFIHMDNLQDVAEAIKEGAIGVMPTDTLYGIVASALDPEAVERVYHVRQRDPNKPFIVLIPDVESVEQFGVVLSDDLWGKLDGYWPGPVSIVLQTEDEQFSYIHRDTYSIAFRVPADESLREFLRLAGPLVAPSANTAGAEPATTIDEARRYFGTDVDFYIDGGKKDSPSSTLVDLTRGEPVILREGAK